MKLSSEPAENPPSAEINEIVETPKPFQSKPVEKPVDIPKLPEHLRKQGYEIDPANPEQAIRKVIKNGREIITTVELSSFEPRFTTSTDALMLLESKKENDPETELGGMHQVDWNSDSVMLLGKFRDKEQDIELALSLRDDDNLEKVCLSFPGKTLTGTAGTFTLRADASGYGIVRFNGNEYLRLIWATDRKRIIHAQFLQRTANEIKVVKSFSATEINRANSEKLERCK